MKTIQLLLLVFLIQSCQADKIEMDCISKFLNEHEMIAFNGSDPGCSVFLELFEWENRKYAVINSYCADIAYSGIIKDCYGNILCDYGLDCFDLIAKSSYLGIIGISQ